MSDKVRWRWSGGHWWVRIDAQTNHVAASEDPGNRMADGFCDGVMWLRYDDLCAAFPGIEKIATPL